jgi:hypothetical protein
LLSRLCGGVQRQDDAVCCGFCGAFDLVSRSFQVQATLVVLPVFTVFGYVVVKLAYFRVFQFLALSLPLGFLCDVPQGRVLVSAV